MSATIPCHEPLHLRPKPGRTVTTPRISLPSRSPCSIQLRVVRPRAWMTSRDEMPSSSVKSGDE